MGEPATPPTAIDVVVVKAGELVTAFEATLTTDRTVVLRVTPPFSARMRGRIHEASGPPDGDPAPVHVPPDRLLSDPPAYPRPAETADRLRADPTTEYSLDRHRRRHRRAIDAWRRAVPTAVTDRATIETPAGPTAVAVRLLEGDWGPTETT